MDMSGLYVDSVSKEYDLRRILSDVYLTCQPGEVIGLLGRNGSGKSTLLQIIFGSLKADYKFVKVDEKVLNSLADNVGLIRYLSQDSFLPSHIKIKTLISVFCNAEKSKKLLSLELVKPHLNKKCRDLSGGERRILEILIMIYSDARYLLFDEPFNGLAPLHVEIIKELIKQHPEKGFIVTDHDYRNVLDISTKLILMYDGGTKVITEKEELVRWGYLPSL